MTSRPHQPFAPAHTHAFTLVELSIVLVIIGLIVGGILVGRDLIKAAEIRAQLSQFEKFDAAIKTFRLKYNAVPGDMVAADTTAFGFTASGGNGDGIVQDYQGYTPMMYAWQEPYFVFIHLSQAGLIEGSYRQVANHYVTGEQFPAAKLGGSGLVYYARSDKRPAYFFGFNVSNNSGGTMFLLSTAGVITPAEAYALDSKMDDGSPTAGEVRPLIFSSNRPVYDTTDNSCSTASTNSYTLSTTTTDCRLIVGAK